MQAKPKIVQILVVALIVSLLLGACGGGTSGRTWFNLPSAKLHVQPDGTARAFGLNLGAVVPATLVQQLQSANIQKLEVRIGYNGIHVYANGEDLPYIRWDADAVETLQDILPNLPQVPNGQMIANLLPWLRTIGLGVLLNIPPAQGQAALDIPRWNGETQVSPTTPEEYAIGPLTIGSLAFDEQGNAIIEGVPAATLQQALGLPPIQLPPNVQSLLQTVGAQTAQVAIQPDGIYLSLNGRPLPGIAYDEQYLSRLQTYLPAFVQDPALVDTLNRIIPLLPATQATVAVSFTGEPAAETELSPVTLTIEQDGRLNVMNLPVGDAPVVPVDVVSNLQAANVQQLNVSLQEDGLYLAANGQALPSVTWTEESLTTLAGIIGPLAGIGAEGISSLLDIATGLGPQITVNVPPAEGAAPIEMPEEISLTVQPVEANPQAATLRVRMAVDGQGHIISLGGITAEEFSQLGVSLPALPPDVVSNLRATGAQEVHLDTEPGMLHLLLDGQEAIRIAYDTASLQTALQIAQPFLSESPLAEPAVNQLVTGVLLPQVPTADVDVVLTLQ
ncbi:MAG TPA: hypothetical protein VNK95_20740 [Caldilineaceae bacterium]|nr:hypothetical protein [Caldilineaceae bacterium]